MTFEKVLNWLRRERSYQKWKFDYEEEAQKPVEFWMQAFENYMTRIVLFGMDTPQGFQAALKLSATTVAFCEFIGERGAPFPTPGVPSGEITEWI